MSNTVAAADEKPSVLPRLATGTLVAAVAACFVAQVGVSIPATTQGYINQDLHVSSTTLTWVSDAFMVPVTLLELSFGVVGDLFGRKRLLAIGAALMALGGLLAFFTPEGHGAALLLTGQVISGIGAAALFPTSIAMIAAGPHSVPDPAPALAIGAAALTTGGFGSPLIGGVLAKVHHSGGEFASWRGAFLAMGLLALVRVVLTLVAAQDSASPEGRSLDWPGQITIAVALFALIYAVVQGASDGWGSPVIIGGFVVAIVVLGL